MQDYYDILSRLKKDTIDAQKEMNGIPDKRGKIDTSKLIQKPVVKVKVKIGK
jgi:hypothetical protein